MMMLVLGIIIGLVVWQIVVMAMEELDVYYDWWKFPIPYFAVTVFLSVVYFFNTLLDIRAYWFLWRIGINPFKTSVTELKAMSDEDKEKLLKYTHAKRAKANLRKVLFGNQRISQ